MSLIPGKRYEWPISNIPSDGKRNGLFTGSYDKDNGNALFMTKNGDTWSVPERDCILVKNRHKGKHRTAYGNYNVSKNWSLNDKRKLNDCQNQIEELLDEE